MKTVITLNDDDVLTAIKEWAEKREIPIGYNVSQIRFFGRDGHKNEISSENGFEFDFQSTPKKVSKKKGA